MVEYVEFLTAKKTLTAVATNYAEIEMPTPSRTGQNIQMVIHKVEFQLPTDCLDADNDEVGLYITNKSYGTTPPANQLDDPNILVYWGCVRSSAAASSMGDEKLITIDFKIPLLVPRMKLYFGGKATEALTVSCRIHYTMRWVSNKQLYDALTD